MLCVLKRYIPRRHEIKYSPDRGLRSSLTLTLTSDDLESHIIVNVSSTLINTTICFVAALFFIVDVYGRTCNVRTYRRTDERTFLPVYRVISDSGVATGGHGWACAHPTSARVGREICTNSEFFWRSRGGGSRLCTNLGKCVCPLQIVYAYDIWLLGALPPDPHRSSAPGPHWGTSVPRSLCPPYLQTLATPLISEEMT